MPSKKHHQVTGSTGERLAEEFLAAKGYIILERNYRFKRSEIDLIAKDSGLLVFIEVKTRKSDRFGFPEEAVSSKKLDKIKDAAEEYIYTNNWSGDVRFDVVSIYLGAKTEIEHMIDISY